MKNSYEILDWDSNFFGFKVASINQDIPGERPLYTLLDKLKKQQVELAYYAGAEEIPGLLNPNKKYDVKLVDKKTTYIKSIAESTYYHENISRYDKAYPENQLIELAIESGIYSRFNMDERIPKDKFREMYKLWIVNSVNKKIAREVLVYMEAGKIAGFITLGVVGNRSDIGIIAVDSQFRGKGIGKALMAAAEKWSEENSFKVLQVKTQGDNLPACGLYEKSGFTLDSLTYFYHIWLSK